MAGILGSAVVQEAISRVSSVIFRKHEEKTSRKESIERLEMAHTELELAIERSGKLPITDVALLHRRKILKRAFKECGDVLHRCKLQAQEDEEIKRGAKPTDSCFPKRIARATKSYLLTMGKDEMSCSNVGRFRWFADCANRFVRDVESGCSLRHHTFSNPLVRHLLQGKTLKHEMEQGGKFRYFHLWPICFEERGVEAQVHYSYVDHETSEKSFGTTLLLRLSESTDIIEIAIKCLHSLRSLFNLAVEMATGELTLLASLHDMSQSYDPPMVGLQELHTECTHYWRIDPVCCKQDEHRSNMIPSEITHRFPEQVILFCLRYSISAPESSLCSLSNGVSTSSMTHRPSPLQVTVAFVPHIMNEEQQESCATEIVGDNEERIDGVSIQQVAKTARSNAINCFLSQPELTGYGMLWRSKHGSAWFMVQKRNSERADWPKTQCWYRTQKKCKDKALEEKAARLCYPNSQHKLLCFKKLVAKS
ncbi:unnamed protein product [Urochloa decumbens]|uniref:Uncharacterized protein n=1 Tax=Urochloa decumbens TaxID=240449 RepID=A0ABC9GVE8_9POAL